MPSRAFYKLAPEQQSLWVALSETGLLVLRIHSDLSDSISVASLLVPYLLPAPLNLLMLRGVWFIMAKLSLDDITPAQTFAAVSHCLWFCYVTSPLAKQHHLDLVKTHSSGPTPDLLNRNPRLPKIPGVRVRSEVGRQPTVALLLTLGSRFELSREL